MRVELGTVARVSSGFAFKSKDWQESGVPVVKIQNVRDGRVELDGCSFVSESIADDARRYELHRGDVLITMTGEIGAIGVVRTGERLMLNQRVGRVELIDPKTSLEFLAFALQHPQLKLQMESIAYGAAQPNISPKLLESLEVWRPNLPVQKQISAALGAFDDLIENNRRRIEILEEMARLLYREWFVHFRFPGHEDVEMVDSELGPIPDGWAVRSVSDVAEIVRGRSYRRVDLAFGEEGLPFLNLKCIDRDGGFRKSGLKRYTGKFKEAQQAVAGDTVIAVTDMTQDRRIVAQAGRVPDLGDPFGVISLDLARVVPGNIDADYLYGMFRYSSFSSVVKEYANGANVLHLSPDRIREYRFAAAQDEVQEEFASGVRPLYALQDNLTRQNEVLREARDLLLPRLVSGELDVSELDLEGVLG